MKIFLFTICCTIWRILVVSYFFEIFIGISNGAGDPTEILRLQQEIESYKKNIEESNHQIEKLVSNLCRLQDAILDYGYFFALYGMT